MSEAPSKRDALLDAAEALFVKEGFWGATTARIAKAAGVATGTLFTYFSSKDELIDEVYLRIKGQVQESINFALESTAVSEELFRLILVSYIQWGCKHPEQHQLMLQLRQENAVSQRVQEQIEEGSLSLLRRGIEVGLLAPLDPLFIHTMVVAQCEATIQYALDQQLSPQEVDACAQQTFSLIWKSLTP